MRHHLAQVNIARMRAALADSVMSGLVLRIDEMNRLAESSKGFVWRLREVSQEDLHVFDDYFVPFELARLFYNLSVWDSIEDLRKFVTKTAHAEMLRDRQRWMEYFERPSLALWWIPTGHRPSIAESAERLQSVQERGPRPYAFTFSTPFEAPTG